MEDLIKALTIFSKYTDTKYPTWCSHDTLHICVDPSKVSEEDISKLSNLGFFISDDNGDYEFISYKYGSC